MADSIYISHQVLKDLAESILVASGVPAGKAKLLVESLVAANLRGVDSHGVMLLSSYLDQFRVGNINLEADGHVISESGGCLRYDGEHGLGQHIAGICGDHAVRLARQHGLGMVVARNSNHFGAAAFWALRISAEGMIGIVMTNASPAVAPWQGRQVKIGTNPICVSVPSGGAGGWLLDMATTTVAKNKIIKASNSGQSTIPMGWAMDSDGIPTQETEKALKGLLMPLGGYKGSGLGLMVEILCACLSGGALSSDVGGLYIADRKMNTSQTFLAIEVSRFLPLDEFRSRMEHLIQDVKSSKAAHGYEEVMVAGDPEWRMEARRLREGIPIDVATWARLVLLAERFSVPLPLI